MTQTAQVDAFGSSPDKADHPHQTRHLNQIELSRRWTISPRTLERWRWLTKGLPT